MSKDKKGEKEISDKKLRKLLKSKCPNGCGSLGKERQVCDVCQGVKGKDTGEEAVKSRDCSHQAFTYAHKYLQDLLINPDAGLFDLTSFPSPSNIEIRNDGVYREMVIQARFKVKLPDLIVANM